MSRSTSLMTSMLLLLSQVMNLSLHIMQPTQVQSPQEESTAEIELHNLTHMPFRSWCPICVRSKGRGGYHKGTFKARAVTQMDYAYIRGNEGESRRTYLVKVLTMAESITGM
eukprot:1935298-Amphidinium_carterae.2